MTGRTFVVASTHARAVAYAREHGLPPYGRPTVLITTPDATRGHMIAPDDAVVVLDPDARTAEAWRFVEATSSFRTSATEDLIAGIVRTKEALATAALGFVPCAGRHGEETPEGFEPPIVALGFGPCPDCGAAL